MFLIKIQEKLLNQIKLNNLENYRREYFNRLHRHGWHFIKVLKVKLKSIIEEKKGLNVFCKS